MIDVLVTMCTSQSFDGDVFQAGVAMAPDERLQAIMGVEIEVFLIAGDLVAMWRSWV